VGGEGKLMSAGKEASSPLRAAGGHAGPDERALAPRLQMLGAAALFSTGGAAIKAVHLAGWPVAFMRSGIAAVALVLLVPEVRRRPTWRMLGVGACYACTMVLFVLANKLTTAASTIFLQATAPLFVLLLSPWLLHERSRRGDVVCMAAIAAGLVLLVAGLEPASATAPQPLRGNLLAAMTGLTWGLTILGMRALGRGGAGAGSSPAAASRADDAVMAALWGNVLAACVALPWTFPLPATSATDWVILAFLGLFQIAFAYRLLTRGIGGVPALEASLLLMLEPVLSPIWAWLVHGERPGPRVLAGGAIILAATLLNSWYGTRTQNPPSKRGRGRPLPPGGREGERGDAGEIR
jgi:DME family drug/metabolite transporter